MLHFDVGEARENRQRGPCQKGLGIAIEHRTGKVHIDDPIGLAVLILQAADEPVFGSEGAFPLVQLRIRRRMIDLDPLGDIVLDRVDQDGPVGGELEPVPARGLFRHERAAALMAMQQAFLAQDIDGLADGDARHFELALELD